MLHVWLLDADWWWVVLACPRVRNTPHASAVDEGRMRRTLTLLFFWTIVPGLTHIALLARQLPTNVCCSQLESVLTLRGIVLPVWMHAVHANNTAHYG